MDEVNEAEFVTPTTLKAKHIQAIKKNDVHQICSGQVVLNLAIAVKELVENSLDAGATSIEVRLKEHGSKLIEVVDNGSGVDEANFQGLTLKHHTSKLQEFSDLISVSTFGFRGEALSSLCALSELSITTRHVDASCGTRLVYDYSGKLVTQTSCARQVGTTISIGNLFGSLPVRQREFHRNIRREFSKMTQLLYAYCLVATNVKITCTNQTSKGNRTTVAATHGLKTVRENIASVFGSKQLQSLLDIKQVGVSPSECSQRSEGNVSSSSLSVESEESDTARRIELVESQFRIDGYISSCDHSQGRGASDRQFFFVNSRPCEPVKIMKLVNEVYHSFNAHQQPFIFLNISMERADVDVNVTPDKRQVFLDNEKELLAILRASLVNLFEGIPSTFRFQNLPVTPRPSSPNQPSTHGTRSEKSPSSSQEDRLASLLNRWKNPASESRPIKRVLEEDADEIVQPKQPCIMNFFQRKTADAPISEELTELQLDTDDGGKLQDSPASMTKHEDDFNVEELSDECAMHVENCIEIKEEHTEKILQANGTLEKPNESMDDSNKIKEEHTEKSQQANATPEESNESMNDSNLLRDPANDSFSNGSPKTMLEIKSKTLVPSVMLADEDIKVSSGNMSKTPESDSELPVEFFSSKRRNIRLDVSFESIKARLAGRILLRKSSEDTVVRFRATIDPSKNKTAEQELSREISKDKFKEMEIIGQFNLGFVVTRLGSDLFIIDQHASDEKFNFETLQQTEALTSQRLVCPVALDLSAVGESVLLDSLSVFKNNGFDFQIDADAETTKRVKMTAIPIGRNCDFGKEDIDELLFMLQDAPGTMCRPSRVRAMFASRACRKSVMIGSALSVSEMRRLVENMGKIEQPWNCPHGRPTMRHLLNLDLLQL